MNYTVVDYLLGVASVICIYLIAKTDYVFKTVKQKMLNAFIVFLLSAHLVPIIQLLNNEMVKKIIADYYWALLLVVILVSFAYLWYLVRLVGFVFNNNRDKFFRNK